MGLTCLYSGSFLRRNKLQHCAMITQNVLAPKTNMGKYLRGGIVGLFVGPKEKQIRTLNVITRLSLSESKVNISAILFLKLR